MNTSTLPIKHTLADFRLWGFVNSLLLLSLLGSFAHSLESVQSFPLFLLVDVFPSGYALPMLTVLLVSSKIPELTLRRSALLSTLLLAVGLGALSLQVVALILPVAMVVLALFTFASGITLATSAWLKAVAPDGLSVCVPALVIAQVISALLQMFLDFQAHVALCGVLILASLALNGILLYRVKSTGGFSEDRPPEHKLNEDMLRKSLPARPSGLKQVGSTILSLGTGLLCVFATSFALAIARTLALRTIDFAEWGYFLPALGRLLGVAVVLLIWLRLKRNVKPERLILGVCVAVILEYALYPFFGPAYPQVFHVFGHALVTISFLLALMASVELIRKGAHSALSLTSALYGSMFAALSLGILVVAATGSSNEGGLISLLLHTLAVVFTLTLVLITVIALWTKRLEAESRRHGEEVVDSTSPEKVSPGDTPPKGASPKDEAPLNPYLAKVYALTKRELDVLDLLRSARSVPHIAKELFISENTVRCHTKSIYQKLNVHSKQELLDLIAEIPPESLGEFSKPD